MNIKENINKIDYNLSLRFETYSISEKSSLKFGKYFEILVRESKDVRIILPFKNIDQTLESEWYYYSNPLNEDSSLVPRSSSPDSFVDQVNDIIENDRFSSDYKNQKV